MFSDVRFLYFAVVLAHWGRVTHICVGNLTIIGSDNGLSPGRLRAITLTNVGILLMGPLGTNFSEMLIESHTFSFKKIHLKMSSGKWRPFCLGLNVLNHPHWPFRATAGIARSILWRLAPWTPVSSRYQQPWYWQSRLKRTLPYTRKEFNYTLDINIELW